MRSDQYIGAVGSVSLRAPRQRYASRTGSMVRQNVLDSYLGRAQLGTHGDGGGRRVSGARVGVFGDPSPVQLRTFGDLCDDAGSTVAGAFSQAGGSEGFFNTVGAGTGDAGATQALGVAGAISSLVGGLWGHQCSIEQARQQAQAPNPGAPADVTAQFQASIAAALQQSTQSQQQAQQAALAQQQAAAAAAAAAAASQRNTLMIAGGVGLGAIVLLGGAYLLLRKK